jgi:hypothetical protein
MRDPLATACEVGFCLSLGIFFAADDWPAAVSLVCFGLFFLFWICRLIDLERGEQ